MALIVQLTIEQTGIELSAGYFRIVGPALQEDSPRRVRFSVEIYASKDARQGGKSPVGYNGAYDFPYDMETAQNIYQDCYAWAKANLPMFAGAQDD